MDARKPWHYETAIPDWETQPIVHGGMDAADRALQHDREPRLGTTIVLCASCAYALATTHIADPRLGDDNG